MDLASKSAKLQTTLRNLGSILVAYSGGTDSASDRSIAQLKDAIEAEGKNDYGRRRKDPLILASPRPSQPGEFSLKPLKAPPSSRKDGGVFI